METIFETALTTAASTATGYAESAAPIFVGVAVAFLGLRLVPRLIARFGR